MIRSASWTPYPETNSTAVDSAVIWPVCFCFWCNFVLVAEEVHSLEIRLIVNEQRRHQLFQLAALVDVIAAAQRNLGAVEPQPLTLIRFHAQCFAHHTPTLC